MIKRVLCYIAVFLLTLYCFFTYDDKVLHMLLAVEVVYFFVSVIGLVLVKDKITALLVMHSVIAEKNKEIPITVLVENQSLMPVVHVDVIISLENSFTGEKMKYRAHSIVDRTHKKAVVIPLKIKECGNLKVILRKLEIYDFFFILNNTIKINETGNIGVMPECTLIPIEISRKTREFIADAEEYSDRESGDDASETYQIREYRKEDSIHDIHWKLSAKSDELLVKEKGRPLGAAILIWLDLEKGTDVSAEYEKRRLWRRNLGQKELLTKLFDVTASISLSLLEEECVHMVAWYEPGNKIIHKKRISKEEHIYELLHRLLYVESYDNGEEVRAQYDDAFKGVDFSSVVKLKMNGTVLVGDEETKVPMKKDRIDWERFYFKV